MFKAGDLVIFNKYPFSPFFVTKIYSNEFMAVANFDELDGVLTEEYIVKQCYFSSGNLDLSIVPGLTYRKFREDLIENCFLKDEKGDLKYGITIDSRNGINPSFGFPKDWFGFTATE